MPCGDQTRPNKCGCAISGAARKPDTGQELAPVLLQRNSGRSDGSITISYAVNMDGLEVGLVDP
jgi:hypothetical protein